jgi:hypothetical protein
MPRYRANNCSLIGVAPLYRRCDLNTYLLSGETSIARDSVIGTPLPVILGWLSRLVFELPRQCINPGRYIELQLLVPFLVQTCR